MSDVTETRAEERIRRWPVWLARLANDFIGWTDTYCAGGCGYPVTGLIEAEIDKVDGIPVVMLVCSAGSDCWRTATENPTDSAGHRYSEVRPEIVKMPRDVDRYRLSFSR